MIVWLALLAVPFQGLASAAMLPCAPLPQAPAVAGHALHEHHDMAAAERHDGTGAHAQHDNASHTHHGKCSTCASCCVGAAMAPPLMAAVAPHFAAAHPVPAYAGYMPSVHLELPDRPPRALRA